MYDRAEKLVAIDDHMMMAITGSYAKSLEVVRYLRSSFRYFERSQLQGMSLEGKLTEVSRLIAGNIPNMMSGIGAFLPVVSAWDEERGCGRVFFYDGLGARFEEDEYGVAGSGSGRIQGVFEYILRTKGRFSEMELDAALEDALVLLNVAAKMDSATGGFAVHLPCAKIVTTDGVADIGEERLAPLCQEILRRAHGV
jgi:proteasome beta subunit